MTNLGTTALSGNNRFPVPLALGGSAAESINGEVAFCCSRTIRRLAVPHAAPATFNGDICRLPVYDPNLAVAIGSFRIGISNNFVVLDGFRVSSQTVFSFR